MVGPVNTDERTSFRRKLRVGFVLLVGVSAGLITLQAGPDPLLLAATTVAGCLVGTVLMWLAFPGGDGETTRY